MPTPQYVARQIENVARARISEEPVIALQGARSVGKSTLLRSIATSLGSDVIDLDDPAVRAVVADDPSAFVRGRVPVCIDEYQHVPQLLDAIKSELNRDLRPGRFILTGSTRYEALPRAAQSLTGRLHLMTIRPLTQTEIAGSGVNTVARLLFGSKPVEGRVSKTDRGEYIDRVTTGGFPIALSRPQQARERWFDDYIATTLERDIYDLARVRRGDALPVLLTRLAGQTAQLLNITKAAEATGLEERTANTYVHLLEALFLVYRLKAWGRTLHGRTGRTAKIHVLDSGLAARLLRLTPTKLSGLTPSALTDFGYLLESFVVGELLAQASWLDGVIATGHWRTKDGDEVDLVIERDDGGVCAVEVKASGRVRPDDLRGLRKLRDLLGDSFVRGVVFYTGAHTYRTEDGLQVLPVDRLWTAD